MAAALDTHPQIRLGVGLALSLGKIGGGLLLSTAVADTANIYRFSFYSKMHHLTLKGALLYLSYSTSMSVPLLVRL